MNLLIFLSDRCNMSCDYCFLSLNQGAAVVLELEAARLAAREHRARHGARARFTVLGGEPFIHYPLLKAVAAAVAEEAPGSPVGVVTNGTRLCPKMLGELSALGARVTVSLDGRAAAHDGHRKLVGEKGSSFAESLKALEGCDKSLLRANMVVCADTVGGLAGNVEALREAGLRSLSFHLNILEPWTADGLAALERSLAGFARYWKALCAAAPLALELSHLASFAPLAPDHGYDELVLGADGRYYPCDGLFSRRYAELGAWTVGQPGAGLDEDKRAAFHGQALAFIHGVFKDAPHDSCPREVYFHARALGADPSPALLSFHRADAVLGRALRGLAGGVHAAR